MNPTRRTRPHDACPMNLYWIHIDRFGRELKAVVAADSELEALRALVPSPNMTSGVESCQVVGLCTHTFAEPTVLSEEHL